MTQKEQILEIITEVWCFTETAEDFYDRLRKRVLEEVPDDDWISVEDMIPDKHWEYLVVDDEVVTTRWWNISDWNNRWLSITHWKPLPLPPSK